jgi:iron complex outermembrane receptor protein
VGVAHDRSEIDFQASTELGALDATRFAVPSGIFLGDAFTVLDAKLSTTGWYVSNVLALSEAASLSLAGRYNDVRVTLRDGLGTALDGDHGFRRFNPALGLSFDVTERLSAYLGYSESNRAPSPVELTCADEDAPCRLPNAFLSDPPLEDVVARTLEAGLRGTWGGGRWHLGVFSTRNEDDILFVSAGTLAGEGYFDNVGRTQREGIELALDGSLTEGLSWFLNYTRVNAIFRERFTVASPNNPAADGVDIEVAPGDRMPLIPRHLLKTGLRAELARGLGVGLNLIAASEAYFRGDEANLGEPVGAYAVASLRSDYRLSPHLELFFNLDNLFDRRYETFGLFGEADEVLGENFEDSRFLSPGAPRAAWIGLSAAF